MPAEEENICIYFAYLSLNQRSPNGVLAARSAIKFFQTLAFPTLESATDSPRVALVVHGIKKKFGKAVKRYAAMTPEVV